MDNAKYDPKYESEEISFPSLMEYYYRLRKRTWLIVSTLVLTFLFTAFFTFTMRPVYRATATILIDEDSQLSPLTGERVNYETHVSQQLTFQTHFKVINSRPVIEKVLEHGDISFEELDRGLVGEFVFNFKQNVKKLISPVLDYFRPEVEEDLVSSEERELTEAIQRLQEKVEIKEVRGTRLLSIEVEDQDPRLAQRLANVLAESYIEYDSEVRLANSRKMLKWLSDQLYESKKKVADAESSFLSFKESRKLFSAQGRQQISIDKMGDVGTTLVEVRTNLLEREAIIEELTKFLEANQEAKVNSIPSFLKSQLMEELYGELVRAQVEFDRLSAVYKGKHPEVLQVSRKIAGLNEKIKNEIDKALDNAKAELAVLTAREKALSEAMKGYEGEAIASNKDQLEYAILEREVETSNQIYSTLLGKIQESDIMGEMPKSVLRLVEQASGPTDPVKPKVMLNLALSLVLGLFLGVGLALFLEFLDQTFHNRSEIERFIDLPVLAEIPLAKEKNLAKNNGKYPGPALNILNLPYNDPFAESHALLATGMKFYELNRRKGAYLITSSAPSEGKSTITYNLGVRLSDMGMKVLVIEGDLRVPASKRMSGLKGKKGLTDVLIDVFGTEVAKGELGEMAVGDLHKLIEIQERTGILFYKSDNHKFRVFFDRGRIVDVDWLTRPAEDRLGSLLLRGGTVTADQIKLALEKQKSTSQRLGQVLLALGFLKVEELSGPLKLQMQENLKQLYRCRQGSYVFKEDVPVASSESDAMGQALAEAIGEVGAMVRPPTPFLNRMIDQHLVKVPETKLAMLTSGKSVPNPASLVGGNRMAALVELCKKMFDVILFDSPPAGGMSDAAILASMCDGIILIVKAGQTSIAEVRRAKDQLSTVPTPIMGAILNMLDMEKNPYYGGYYSKYYRYGYGTLKED